jgi:ribosome biogenesis GTPase / thiamine phosphate phosphatase
VSVSSFDISRQTEPRDVQWKLQMTELVKFGWTDYFAQHFVERENFAPARVVAVHRSGYRLQTDKAECPAGISGKLRHESVSPAELPVVGDWVVAQLPTQVAELTVHSVLPRKTKFSRKVAGDRTEEQVVAANVDTVWIVSSLDQDFSVRRIERYLTLAWESGADPVIVLTKSDLNAHADRLTSKVESMAIGTRVHTTSSLTRDSLNELDSYFRNHATVALLGSSGVGKSTLINILAGSAMQETADVRADGKGRHTTTRRQLIRLPSGGLIIDRPGMRELQLWGGQTGLADTSDSASPPSRAKRSQSISAIGPSVVLFFSFLTFSLPRTDTDTEASED